MNTRIEQYNGLNRTPAALLAAEGHLELLRLGFADTMVYNYWDDEALVAFDADSQMTPPLGVITFQHTKHYRQIDLKIGYVREPFRRMGVYRKLWEQLVGLAVERKAVLIRSGVHIDNVTMQNVALSQGRMIRGYTFDYPIRCVSIQES
jgi:GNAT superfamily N-acetyltransferase